MQHRIIIKLLFFSLFVTTTASAESASSAEVTELDIEETSLYYVEDDGTISEDKFVIEPEKILMGLQNYKIERNGVECKLQIYYVLENEKRLVALPKSGERHARVQRGDLLYSSPMAVLSLFKYDLKNESEEEAVCIKYNIKLLKGIEQIKGYLKASGNDKVLSAFRRKLRHHRLGFNLYEYPFNYSLESLSEFYYPNKDLFHKKLMGILEKEEDTTYEFGHSDTSQTEKTVNQLVSWKKSVLKLCAKWDQDKSNSELTGRLWLPQLDRVALQVHIRQKRVRVEHGRPVPKRARRAEPVHEGPLDGESLRVLLREVPKKEERDRQPFQELPDPRIHPLDADFECGRGQRAAPYRVHE